MKGNVLIQIEWKEQIEQVEVESCEESQICVQLTYIAGTEIRYHINIFLLDEEDFVI